MVQGAWKTGCPVVSGVGAPDIAVGAISTSKESRSIHW